MFDTIWSDILYMEDFIDFTVDDANFAGLRDFIDELHDNHLQFVPVVDVAISIKTDSKGVNWYQIGNDMGVFVKTARYPKAYDGNLLTHVWPEFGAFIDFLHPNATEFWGKGLQALYDIIPYDGVWLDMNEPSNF